MGKYTLAGGASRPTGSQQGSTFQKCGKVFSIRKRSVIVQKRTPKQSTVKNSFAHQVQKWRALTGGQKTNFISAASSYPRVDSLGNSYTISGQQLQTSTNINRRNFGMTELTTVAGPAGAPSRTVGSRTVSQGSFIINFQIFPVTVSSGFKMMLYCSRPLPAGRTSVNSSELKFITFYNNGATTNTNIYANYTAVFGLPQQTIGQRIFIRMVFMQISSGQIQLTLNSSVIVNS